MGPAAVVTASQPLILHLGTLLRNMSDHEYFVFCQLNPDWRIERTEEGDLIIMPPTGGRTGARNFTLAVQFGQWVEADGTGLGFDSSTGFALPSGAKRSPDLAWIRRARWDALTPGEQEEFPPLCPDFVIELRSPSDDLVTLQAKMQEYMRNGAQLGWLIDPRNKQVYVYATSGDVVRLDDPGELSGEPLLHGFTLDVRRLWS